MRECAKLFINWLDGIDGEEILDGYNATGCDVRMICKDFREVNMEKELRERILGFCDTLPLLRRLYPNQESHSQPHLCKAMIGYSYTAHNALEDAKALEKLLTTSRIREQDMTKNSISIDLAFKNDVCLENEVKYLPSLTPMVTEKVVSKDMAKKIAGSGLCFRHLCIAFRRGNREGLSKLLSEKSGKRVKR